MVSSRFRWPTANRQLLLLILGLAALVAVGLSPLGGAERPNEPPYFAIRGARIVPVSGPAIEAGTLVMARGVITAVGANVTIPPEAWVIDGKGLTVYPGLIDSLTNLGLPTEAEARPGAGPPGQAGQRQQISQGPQDRPATTSWENAADQLNLEDKRLESWRKAGFTSAVTSPDKGIFPGQAALINLAGDRPNQLVVKTPVALRINLTPLPGFWNFPDSLMGVLAYIKQLFLDADQYAKAWTMYSSAPHGLERPNYDRTLEPIRQAVAGRWPVLIPATWSKEILRGIKLGEDIGANTLLYGGHQGYETAAVLAAKRVPILVSLKWPDKPTDGDPEAEEALRVLRLRDRAPSTPAALQKAGAKFAFYSDGLYNPQDILKNVRKAVEAGLPADAALRAFTLSAAEIYGVADRLGSLEPGKMANLVVTDGDLFAEKTKVKMTFIDGRKYEVREPARPTEPPTVKLTGKWTLSVNTSQGPEERTADLTMAEDGTLTGTITGRWGTISISNGWVSGKKFSFTITIPMGPRTVEATYSGAVEADKMTGSVSTSFGAFEFTGTRPGDSSGTPKAIR